MALLARLGGVAGQPAAENPLREAGELRVTMVLDAGTRAKLDAGRLNVINADVRLFDGSFASFAGNAPMIRRTDLLVVQIDPANAADLAALESFAVGPGQRIPVVAAVADLTIAITRQLLRSSIADVLPIPFSLEELGQAIDAARDRVARATGQGPARQASIIAVQGALGGMGASMVASQLAQIWADDKQVLLIDLDLQRGNAALYLNLKPRLSIADLVEAEDRLDVEFLRMVVERHQSGVGVVAAPADMNPLDAITPEFIDRLLDVAAQNYDLVVLDMPGLWLDWTAAALQKSDLVLLVTQMTVSGVQQARRQLDVLEANALADRARVAINRLSPGLFGKYDLSDAEAVLRFRVHFPLCNDYPTVSAALDEGRPVGQMKLKARIDRDLRAMATALTAELVALEAAQ
ncbi:MAG: AAA family ATPase [Alphaproteobacteria bacterium]|nr:AAA family ATPase [Alphaproteobacteria bacterium]